MDLELSGLKVIVTAAGAGIGRATATYFAQVRRCRSATSTHRASTASDSTARSTAVDQRASHGPRHRARSCRRRQVSMRTLVEAADIADSIAYLASPLGSKVSGQVLSVDGHTEMLRTS
jgi:NAD(P)-dependent dehydrogenase (short-subunit alcohol dehydrogenase family)